MGDKPKPLDEAPVVLAAGWPQWRTLLVSPLLYGMIVPLVFLDIFLELYHRVVFLGLGIPFVRRSEYILFDRYRLPFLSPALKLACAYCSYANGLLQYAARIAGETEAYFCPSKHQKYSGFHAPAHHEHFADYGDQQGFFLRFHRRRDDHQGEA